jgi:signal transduction histidine kinase
MLSLGLEACVDASDGGTAPPSPVRDRLQALVGVSKQALWEARRYIFDLAPSDQGERSLVAMLENLTREFETVSRVATTMTVEGEPRRVPPAVSAALYRIGQEALANVFKHAQAKHVAVTLAFLPATVRLVVSDDGRGLAEAGPGGHGLANMRQRVQECNGRFAIESAPDGGTRICAEVPT